MDAQPDGQTMLIAPLAVPVLIPLLARKLDYDPGDLEPISQVAEYAIAFAVPADHPATTLREYINWARAQPRGTVFGSPGAGGLPDLLGLLLAQAADFNLEHLAYRSAAPLAADLAGGHIPAGASALSDFIALHRAGKLRILATSGKQRSPLTADIPTFVEQGYPAVHGMGWTSLVVLKGTSRKDIETLSNWVRAIVHSPEVLEHLQAAGLEPTGTTPEALAAIIAADIKRWRPVVERSGIVIE
jgi:tripartite-type tricarboxylate transporter receptor subunit TctC